VRTIVLLVVCLTLALHGTVQARGVHKPCPMGQSEHAATADATAPAQEDCCDDADTAAKTGKPCKTCAECQAPNPGALAAQSHPRIAPALPHPKRTIEALIPADNPAGVWRPPALI
jgi:hypothetical protein